MRRDARLERRIAGALTLDDHPADAQPARRPPDGQYDPIPYFAGRQVGDRSLIVYDLTGGTIRSLPHEPGYVEEGARPSRDGTRLLVLRRKPIEATDLRSIPDAPLEVWVTDAEGERGSALVRISKAGPGYYGWYAGPSEWDWSD